MSAHGLLAQIGVRIGTRDPGSPDARGASTGYERRLAALAFLAPDLQAAIVAGRQPAGLKLQHLLGTDLPLAWADQRKVLGF